MHRFLIKVQHYSSLLGVFADGSRQKIVDLLAVFIATDNIDLLRLNLHSVDLRQKFPCFHLLPGVPDAGDHRKAACARLVGIKQLALVGDLLYLLWSAQVLRILDRHGDCLCLLRAKHRKAGF